MEISAVQRGLPMSRVALPLLLLAALLALPSCREEPERGPEEAPAPVEEPTVDAQEPEAPEGPTLDAEARGRARDQLARMKQRRRCNRVMGCAPATALMQHGSGVVPDLVDALESAGAADGYWVLRAVDLLGQLDDDRALPVLHDLTEDTRWEVRARSARALARLARPESLEPLREALGRARNAGQPAVEAAVLMALDRLDADVGDRPAREVLEAHLAMDYDTLAGMNPGMFAFLAEVVREARVPAALPLARLGATHRDRFVRLVSIETLGALHDTGGIPFLIGRLDDPLPSVRRATIRALQDITGSEGLSTAEQWRAWCETRGCRADLDRGLPAGAP
ncbi:MAG: HEAT repeat domain-containing protein [Myxococcota bacterium]